MVKSELINLMVSQKEGLSRRDVEAGVHAVLEYMSLNLSSGKRIELRGFGSFSLHFHPPRKAHNPKTGARVYTEAKYSPHFKPGKELRERVNENRMHCAIQDAAKDDEDDSEE